MRALLLALAACSVPATQFEPLGPQDCTPQPMRGTKMHDEDGDGVVDACDMCPHVADDQTDSDGDGVGDACDPEPNNPRQTILFFAPMTPDDPTFAMQAMWTKLADAWRNDATGATTNAGDLTRAGMLADVELTMRANIAVMSQSLGHLAISINPPTTGTQPFYYAEITEQMSGTPRSYAAISWYDGTSYVLLTKTALVNGYHTGMLLFHIVAHPGTSPTWKLDITWDGEATTTVQAAAPAYAGNVTMDIRNQSTSTEIDWVIAIATMP